MPDVPLPLVQAAAVVGVDLGLRDFAVTSSGTRIPVVLARRKKNSKRRLRARRLVARTHAQTANQRSDFLHKMTTGLVRNYPGICIEDLSVKGLARTKLAKSVLDRGLGEFRRQLEYKTIWSRHHLAVGSFLSLQQDLSCVRHRKRSAHAGGPKLDLCLRSAS
jgi:putative transposase